MLGTALALGVLEPWLSKDAENKGPFPAAILVSDGSEGST